MTEPNALWTLREANRIRRKHRARAARCLREYLGALEAHTLGRHDSAYRFGLAFIELLRAQEDALPICLPRLMRPPSVDAVAWWNDLLTHGRAVHERLPGGGYRRVPPSEWPTDTAQVNE